MVWFIIDPHLKIWERGSKPEEAAATAMTLQMYKS